MAGVALCGDGPASLRRDRLLVAAPGRGAAGTSSGARVGWWVWERVPSGCAGKNGSAANPLQALMGCARGWAFSAPHCSFLAVFGRNVAVGSTDRGSWRGL